MLPPQAEMALEVSTSGYFAMSVLEEAGWRERAHWVHTAGIDSLRKQQTDRLHARRLTAQHSDPSLFRKGHPFMIRSFELFSLARQSVPSSNQPRLPAKFVTV